MHSLLRACRCSPLAARHLLSQSAPISYSSSTTACLTSSPPFCRFASSNSKGLDGARTTSKPTGLQDEASKKSSNVSATASSGLTISNPQTKIASTESGTPYDTTKARRTSGRTRRQRSSESEAAIRVAEDSSNAVGSNYTPDILNSLDEAAEQLLSSMPDTTLAPDFAGLPFQDPLPALESSEGEVTEEKWAASLVHGRGVQAPYYHKRTSSVPVASIQFRSYSPYRLELYTHFVTHAASSLGIPVSKVIMLPRQRQLWTVIRSPFVHKKSQENFERRTHRRAIKAWDAHPDVVDLWVGYIRKHAMGGVGMRVTRWERKPVGFGQRMLESVGNRGALRTGDKVRQLGEKIVEIENTQQL